MQGFVDHGKKFVFYSKYRRKLAGEEFEEKSHELAF